MEPARTARALPSDVGLYRWAEDLPARVEAWGGTLLRGLDPVCLRGSDGTRYLAEDGRCLARWRAAGEVRVVNWHYNNTGAPVQAALVLRNPLRRAIRLSVSAACRTGWTGALEVWHDRWRGGAWRRDVPAGAQVCLWEQRVPDETPFGWLIHLSAADGAGAWVPVELCALAFRSGPGDVRRLAPASPEGRGETRGVGLQATLRVPLSRLSGTGTVAGARLPGAAATTGAHGPAWLVGREVELRCTVVNDTPQGLRFVVGAGNPGCADGPAASGRPAAGDASDPGAPRREAAPASPRAVPELFLARRTGLGAGPRGYILRPGQYAEAVRGRLSPGSQGTYRVRLAVAPGSAAPLALGVALEAGQAAG